MPTRLSHLAPNFSMTRRKWLWVLLFVWLAGLVAVLATGWNVVLVQDYYRMLDLAKRVAQPGPHGAAGAAGEAPWLGAILGTLGFVALLGTIVLFFVRLLREMRLNQMQSEFLATISHELKTPIAAMELSSSLLRAGGLTPDEVEHLWESHQAELKRLREDVEALLEAARSDSRAPRLREHTDVPLESWLTESMRRWSKILGPGAKLRREGQALDARVSLDLKTFNLIADNIIDNARKYARGAPEVTVRTEIARSRFLRRPYWRLSIEDRGWGFQPTDAKRIFTRFYRARTSSSSAIPGTGLGLYLASAASRNLGLTIRAASPGPQRGSVFTIEGRAAR